MKKLFICLAITLLALVTAAPPAFAGRDMSVSQFCKENSDFGLNHGECVTIFSNGNSVPHIVEQCIKVHVQQEGGTAIFEECVERIRDLVD